MIQVMLRGFRAYRVARTVWTGLRIRGRFDNLGDDPSEAQLARAHRKTARDIHDLASELEGLFIKLAQMLGGRPDVMPEAYARVLGRFHDRVQPRPFRQLEIRARRSLGRPLAEVFSDIDPTPLAAASLAQVHRARLKDGHDVVLKIQYPEIASLVRVDLATLMHVGQRLIRRFGTVIDSASLLEELSHFLELELDFTREAASTARVAKAFEGNERIRIPRVYTEHSSRKLLVLEYLPGTPLTDRERLASEGADLPELARVIADAYAAMIFEHGFFHGDPHPGNLLRLPDGTLGLLDFGLSKELPERFGSWTAALIVRGLGGDKDGALEAARALGFNIDTLTPELLAELTEQATGRRAPRPAPVRRTAAMREERRTNAARQRSRMRKLAEGGEPLRIPPHFALIGRTMMLLNGLSEHLAPGQRIVQQRLRAALIPYAAGVATKS